jgi:Flp pilus assembly secretin CpaC
MSVTNVAPHRRLNGPISVLLAASTALTAVLIQVPAARAEDLIVKYDQSQLLRLPRTPAEVIIGNPSIADVSVQGGNMLVITGKSFGITNVITLDSERNIIQDQRVIVQRDDVRTVSLHKGAKRETYNCSPQCNPTITIGDETTYFGSLASNTKNKLVLSDGVSDGGNTGGQ